MLPRGRIYIEKILVNDERLNTDWDVDGTVGYDFLAEVNRLWMAEQGADALTATYFDFTKQPVNIASLVRQKKRDILDASFSADHNRISALLSSIAQSDWKKLDLSPRQISEAIAALTVELPIYRTYRDTFNLSEYDKRIFQ